MHYFSLGCSGAGFCRMVMVVALGCALPAWGDEQVLLESSEARITDKDFEAEIARIPVENRAEVLTSRDRIRKLLEGLLINKTMAARARASGLDREPALVKRMELAAEKVLVQEQITRIVKNAEVPDFDARARDLYRINIENYALPEKVHASHILVEARGRTPEEALKRIQEVRALALEGKDFGELALQYSDDRGSKGSKGDLGFFEAGRMVKPFSDAAFAMSTPGEISEPVKTRFGYHIIRFHEKQPKKVRPFEEVKAKIVQGLRSKYLTDYRQDMLGKIVNDPALKFNVEAVERYKTNLELPASSTSADMEKQGVEGGESSY